MHSRLTLYDERRRDALMTAAGSVEDGGHDWDDDAGAWVTKQRLSDPSRVG